MFLKKVEGPTARVPEFPDSPLMSPRGKPVREELVPVARHELEAVAAKLKLLNDALAQRTRVCENAVDTLRRAVAEYKTYSYMVATGTVDDLVKLRRAQEVTKVAVDIVKLHGSSEQKAALAAALKELSQVCNGEVLE